MDKEESTSMMSRYLEIFNSLQQESDRGCVLVVGSMIELAIEEQISRRIVHPANKSGEIMGRGNKPISTFSAKIDFGYALGLFPEEEWCVYHQLRELRNACAHDIRLQHFDANHFSDRMRNIISASKTVWPILANKIGDKLFNSSTPLSVEDFVKKLGWRNSFEMFFSLIISHKEVSIDRVAQIKPLYMNL